MINSSCIHFPAKNRTSFLRAEFFCTDSLLSNPTCISQVLRKLSCQMQATKMQFYCNSGLFCLLFRQLFTHPALSRLSTDRDASLPRWNKNEPHAHGGVPLHQTRIPGMAMEDCVIHSREAKGLVPLSKSQGRELCLGAQISHLPVHALEDHSIEGTRSLQCLRITSPLAQVPETLPRAAEESTKPALRWK